MLISLSETTRPGALIFGIKYHLADLYQVCSNYAPRAKNGPTRGPGGGGGGGGGGRGIDLYRENMKKSSCLKPRGLVP